MICQVAKLLSIALIFTSPPASAGLFDWFSSEPEGPSEAYRQIMGCFSRLTNVYPDDQSSNPIPRGNLKWIQTSCSGNLISDPNRQLLVLPVVENGRRSLFVMEDNSDGQFRIKRFEILQQGTPLTLSLEREYLNCRVNTNSGGGPELLRSPLTLRWTQDSGTPPTVAIRQVHESTLPGQVIVGQEDMGPHITRRIYEDATRNIQNLRALQQRANLSSRDADYTLQGCQEMARNPSVLPQDESSQAALEQLRQALAAVQPTGQTQPENGSTSGSQTGD